MYPETASEVFIAWHAIGLHNFCFWAVFHRLQERLNNESFKMPVQGSGPWKSWVLLRELQNFVFHAIFSAPPPSCLAAPGSQTDPLALVKPSSSIAALASSRTSLLSPSSASSRTTTMIAAGWPLNVCCITFEDSLEKRGEIWAGLKTEQERKTFSIWVFCPPHFFRSYLEIDLLPSFLPNVKLTNKVSLVITVDTIEFFGLF